MKNDQLLLFAVVGVAIYLATKDTSRQATSLRSNTYPGGPLPSGNAPNFSSPSYSQIQALPLQERQKMYLQTLGENGIENNNTSSAGAALIRMFDPNYGPINIEEQAAYFYPEIKATQSLDRRFEILNSKLAAVGIPFKLSRIHKTGFPSVLKILNNPIVSKAVSSLFTKPATGKDASNQTLH